MTNPDPTAVRRSDLLDAHAPAHILRTDEAGSWVWAVVSDPVPGFWLDAFDTRDDAVGFCRTHAVPVSGTFSPYSQE